MLLCVVLAFLGSCGSSKQFVAVPDEEVPPIDEMPEFPGGLDALVAWLGQNIQYPEAAQRAGVQGKVLVAFTVEVDGSISDCKVIQSLSPACDGGINQRLKSIEVRKLLTDEWKRGGVEGQQYASLTDIITAAWSGRTTKQYKHPKYGAIL